MISANEAYKLATNSAIIKKIKREIEEGVNEQINKGEFHYVYQIRDDIQRDILEGIVEDIKILGYGCKLTNYAEEYKNAPSDQRPWYEEIHIRWNL